MMKGSKVFLFLTLFLLIASVVPPFVQNARAVSTYYVSTTGSDTTGTGSFANPFKTPSKAVNVSISGDSIFLRGGTYTPGSNIFIKNFAGPDWLTISGYPGETAIIDGMNTAHTNYLNATIELKNCHYVRITDLTINHSYLGGITIQSTPSLSSYISLDNLTVGNCSSFAIKANDGSYIYVKDNYIYNNFCNWSGHALSQETISFSSIDYGYIERNYMIYNHCEQIDVKYNSKHVFIRNNTIFNSASKVLKNTNYYNGGIGVYSDAIGGVNTNITIEGNHIEGNNSGIQINNEASTGHFENITVRNNDIFITNPSGGGISATQSRIGIIIAKGDSGDTNTDLNKDILVYQNTVQIDEGCYYAAFQVGINANKMYRNYISRLNVSNNIFTMHNTAATNYYIAYIYGLNYTDVGATYIALHNNLWNNSYPGQHTHIQWLNGDGSPSTYGTRWGNNSLFVQPEFKSRTAGDFHLNSTSPCIDYAMASLVSSWDADGTVRPKGAGYDIGAYEWGPIFSISGVTPVNGSSSVLQRACNLTISESHGWKFNYTLQTNSSGGWYTQASVNNAVNGSKSFDYTNVTVAVRDYWWRICAVNKSVWHNETYHFTTTGWMYPGTRYHYDNKNYSVMPVLGINFSNITILAHSITFNGIGFNVTSTPQVYVNYSYFKTYPKSTVSGQMVFNLSTSTTNQNATFNVSGLKNSYTYKLLNGSALQSIVSSAAGKIQWKHNLTTSHVFTLYDWPSTLPILTEAPTNGTTGMSRFPRVEITAVDAGLRITTRFYENTTGVWKLQQVNQSILSGGTVRWTYTNASVYNKEYWWQVVTNNSATPNGWANATYHFTTRASLPTVLLGPSPVNGSIDVPVTAGLSVFIMDPDGDLFNWSITTSPNVGSASGVNAANGTKTCSVNLSFFTIYYWNVSAVDPSGVWTNASYHFRTVLAGGVPSTPYYMFVVTARYKSNYTVIPDTIVSFGGTIFMANHQGIAIFWKQAGLYRLIAGKAGYAAVTQDVILSADQSLTVYMESGSAGIDALPDVNAVGFIFVALFCVSMVWLKRNRSKT